MTSGGAPLAVTAVAVDAAAKTVTLTLASNVSSGAAVTVAYADPTTGNDLAALQDASGNDAASLMNLLDKGMSLEAVAAHFMESAELVGQYSVDTEWEFFL